MFKRYYQNKPCFARSKFRSSFKLNEKDIVYINKITLEKIKEHAKEFIAKKLAPAFPRKDGKQTPYSGHNFGIAKMCIWALPKLHPVFKAQHASAFCCRNCLMKWYKIEKGRQLDKKEINEIVEVIMKWIKEKYE